METYKHAQILQDRQAKLLTALKNVLSVLEWETSNGPEQKAYDEAMEVINEIEGTPEGQDREGYTDDQDRESYSAN